jgi:hypothetical protein
MKTGTLARYLQIYKICAQVCALVTPPLLFGFHSTITQLVLLAGIYRDIAIELSIKRI